MSDNLVPPQEINTVGELRKLIAPLSSDLRIVYAENPLAMFQTIEIGTMRADGKLVCVIFPFPQ